MTKRKWGWLAASLLFLALLSAVYTELHGVRTVQTYQLNGSLKQQDRSEVDRVLQAYLGRSFWEVDLEKLQAELKRLDWVQQAVVKRSWPDRIVISIQEQVPVARWGEEGLINRQGAVFFPNRLDGFHNLVRLDGRIERSAELLARLSEFQGALSALQWSIERLEERADGVWRIQVLNGPVLIVDGFGEQGKLERFLHAYPKLKEAFRKSARVYDLRYSNGFSIKVNRKEEGKTAHGS